MSEPKISVIMPAYNAEKYIAEAIESILSQTFTDFEFIIINDASTDSTKEVVKSFKDQRIKLINNEQNQGVAESLNIGISVAKGQYIARMDADDIALPHRFQTQFEFMEQNPDIDICGSWVKTFGTKDGTLKHPLSNEDIKDATFFYCSLVHPTTIFKNELNLRYSSEFPRAEDYDLWTHMIDKLKFANIPENLLLYRVHDNKVGNLHKSEQKDNSNDIRLRNLKNISLVLSEKEQKIYCDFFSDEFRPENIEEIMNVIKIFEKISFAGNTHGYGKKFQELVKFYQKRVTDLGIRNHITSLKLYFTTFRKLKIFETPRGHLRYLYYCLRNILHV